MLFPLISQRLLVPFQWFSPYSRTKLCIFPHCYITGIRFPVLARALPYNLPLSRGGQNQFCHITLSPRSELFDLPRPSQNLIKPIMNTLDPFILPQVTRGVDSAYFIVQNWVKVPISQFVAIFPFAQRFATLYR